MSLVAPHRVARMIRTNKPSISMVRTRMAQFHDVRIGIAVANAVPAWTPAPVPRTLTVERHEERLVIGHPRATHAHHRIVTRTFNAQRAVPVDTPLPSAGCLLRSWAAWNI